MKKHSVIFLLIITLIFSFSCNIGLGDQVDLEAPSIRVKEMKSGDESVSDFAGGIYCNKMVTFSGLATDNEKVEKVYAEIKWSDESEFRYLKPAVLNGEEWTVDIDLGREGTAYLKFIATDSRKNFGINSTKQITLLVDDTAPVGEAWYIDRKLNGIQYNLKEKEELLERFNNFESEIELLIGKIVSQQMK